MPDNSIDSCITDPPYGITFMGRGWDKGLPSTEVWKEVLRVVKPGGSLMSFGSTRTFHRLACAIEDAGWEIRDTISWNYGSGFPKSMNIAKSMEKAGNSDYKKWQGWGTALKPAWEPVVWAMKPLDGTYVQNLEKWEVAGINIDGTRIQTNDNLNGGAYAKDGKERHDGYDNWRYKREGAAGEYKQPEGRFPANIILTHHPECECQGTKKVKAITGGGGSFNEDGTETVEKWDCHPDCPLRILNEQTSNLKGGSCVGRNRNPDEIGNEIYGARKKDTNDVCYGDSGGASRFFYCAKASRSERNIGCQHLFWHKDGKEFHLVDEETWNQLPPSERTQGNIHVTVKPLALMQYLCKMMSMPHPTTVLDPFCGSGSTGVAAIRSGMNFVGFDNDESAAIIAEARLFQEWSNLAN